MYIVQVFIHVKPDKMADFEAATIANAEETAREPLVARFDLVRQLDDPTRYALLEVYRSKEGHAQHKETTHYKRWAAAAEPMLVEPRTRTMYENVHPDDSGWG